MNLIAFALFAGVLSVVSIQQLGGMSQSSDFDVSNQKGLVYSPFGVIHRFEFLNVPILGDITCGILKCPRGSVRCVATRETSKDGTEIHRDCYCLDKNGD